MKRTPAILVFCVVVVAAAALLTRLSRDGHEASPATPVPVATKKDPQEIRVAMDLWPGYYPLLLAKDLGYLHARGIDVEVSFPQDTHRMISDFAAGKYDGICVSLGDMILAHQRDPDIRMVLCSDESAGADQIVGKAALAEAGGLKGRRIGTTLGGFGELLVRRFVASRSLNVNDVGIVNADAADCVTLLEQGAIDAAHTWEPYASEARKKGFTLLYSSEQTPGLILDGLIVHQKLLRENPALARGLVAAWFEALDWWQANSAEGNNRIQRLLRASRIPDRDISLEGIHLQDLAANRLLFTSQQPGSLHAAAKEYITFFLARGSLTREPDPSQMLDSSALP